MDMNGIREAVEYFKPGSMHKIKDLKEMSDILQRVIVLRDLAEKVLAVGGKMPEKFNLKSSPRKEYYNRLLHNQAIDQCTLTIARMLLSEDDLLQIIRDTGSPQGLPLSLSEKIATAIHSAQMEKLGGVR